MLVHFVPLFCLSEIVNFVLETNMLETIYSLPFLVLCPPNLKIKQPSWFHQPSAMTMFSLVLLSYFLVTGGKDFCRIFKESCKCLKCIFIYPTGIIYDVIVEPPSVGSTTDEHGHSRPVIQFTKKASAHQKVQ